MLTALVAGTVSRFWTLRRIRKADRKAAHISASQTASVEHENAELRALVERQESRIRSLETIATDPAERTAREIEMLRDR
ncbi:hypothetical protein [Sphingomonas turrisvirgatae]|uniref:hypothetical protein n=1 Tax=Sphingomonas turrisvirgatae TaxID=1888892 RepID=UPI000E5D1D2E|nr:hypothetical protein [Sphingomonas turrisvirgatae]